MAQEEAAQLTAHMMIAFDSLYNYPGEHFQSGSVSPWARGGPWWVSGSSSPAAAGLALWVGSGRAPVCSTSWPSTAELVQSR